jgi:hypothetical protein
LGKGAFKDGKDFGHPYDIFNSGKGDKLPKDDNVVIAE